MRYPGVCSLEYQQIIEIFVNCMLNWDSKNQQACKKGILGRVLVFAPTHEEQGRKTLHSHWQVWTEDLSQEVCDDLWSSDPIVWKKAREAFYQYIDEVMSATYSKPLKFTHRSCKPDDSKDNNNDIFQRSMKPLKCHVHQLSVIGSLTRMMTPL